MPAAKKRAAARKRAPAHARKKTTAALKDAILNAFATVGGEAYLARLAEENPRIFCALLAKVLPLQVAGDPGGAPIKTVIEVAWRGTSGSTGGS
jgi:hypothetical protein